MRRTAKFFHSLGAIGLAGAIAAQLVLLQFLPPPGELANYAQMRAAMNGIAEWIIVPSLALVLLTGLWSMAITPAFHNAGWAWLKLATGILVFKGTLISIVSPARREAELAVKALAGEVDPAALGQALGEERGVLWVVLVVAIANVVLGVWRPRFSRARREARARAAQIAGKAQTGRG